MKGAGVVEIAFCLSRFESWLALLTWTRATVMLKTRLKKLRMLSIHIQGFAFQLGSWYAPGATAHDIVEAAKPNFNLAWPSLGPAEH